MQKNRITFHDVVKYYDSKRVYSINNIQIKAGDKVALIGNNGRGKTTLLNQIYAKDKGINVFGRIAYHRQWAKEDIEQSAGEYIKANLISLIFSFADILLLDEPFSNLDIDNRRQMSYLIKKEVETCVIVSHDSKLIKDVCNKVMVIENRIVKLYDMDYETYVFEREKKKKALFANYDRVIDQKKHLEMARKKLEKKRGNIKKAPNRMGNSEARLHRRSDTNAKKQISKQINNIENRLKRINVDKPKDDLSRFCLNINKGERKQEEKVIRFIDFSLSINDNLIIDNCTFHFERNLCNFLVGKNGAGKTSILKAIIEKEKGVFYSNRLKINYFEQQAKRENISISEYLKSKGLSKEIYYIIKKLSLEAVDLNRDISKLSGGEWVKMQLMIFQFLEVDVVIFDEPTNYLDIESVEILKEGLINFKGTTIIVSHDEDLIDAVAKRILLIENRKVEVV